MPITDIFHHYTSIGFFAGVEGHKANVKKRRPSLSRKEGEKIVYSIL